MNLNRSRLTEIAGLSDPLGVLSIYVTAEPGEEAERPAWQVRTRNALEKLRQHTRDSADRERDQALRRRLDELAPDLNWLLSRSTSGRGRALFAPLSNGDVHQIAVQEALGDHVRCDERAYLRPLLTAWQTGSPAGVAVATGEGMRILGLQLGQAEELAKLQYDDPSGEWRELKGPAGVNPARSQQTAPQHDLFESKRGEHLKRFLASGHDTLRRHAAEHGWEFLVMAGEPQLRDAVVERLGHDFTPTIVASPHVLGMSSPPAAAVAEQVMPTLVEARRERDRARVKRLDETKNSARGIDQTLAAVQESRAELILMDSTAEWSGRRDPQGRYVAGSVTPPGAGEEPLAAEPELGERIVELAMRNGAEVAMLPPDVAAELTEADGVAAVLRW